MPDIVNQLTDLSGAPLTVKIGDADVPLCPLKPKDFAEVQRHIEGIRLRQYMGAAKGFNLPSDTHAVAMAKIVCTPMTTQDMWDDWECVCMLLWRSARRGGCVMQYEPFKEAIPPTMHGMIRDILAMISNWITPADVEKIRTQLAEESDGPLDRPNITYATTLPDGTSPEPSGAT